MEDNTGNANTSDNKKTENDNPTFPTSGEVSISFTVNYDKKTQNIKDII
jgi:hypothetical protein